MRSEIRQNIVEILQYLQKGYGYQIAKIYKELFPDCTMEVIYYHLRKGVKTGEFEIHTIVKEKGEYSWGGEAEKIYYKLGANAQPKQSKRVEQYIAKLHHKS